MRVAANLEKKAAPDAAGERSRAPKRNLASRLDRLACGRRDRAYHRRGVAPERAKRGDARRNREAVIEAAIELLAKEPDASMKEIADASELGRTTVYRHFSTRDDLFREMLGQALTHTWGVAEGIFAKDERVEPTLRELSGQLVEIGARYRFLLGYRGAPALQDSRTSTENPIKAYFEGAQARGEIRSEVPLHWVMSSFQALSLVAMQDLAAGMQSQEETAALLADSLIALLVSRNGLRP
jgi:AcrR family transcriptional regulator